MRHFVVVFKAALYDETVAAANYRDYVQFMGKISAKPLELPIKDARGHHVSLQGRRLVCLHEYFNMQG